MTTRSELAAMRAQALDRVRAATGQAERFTLHCACARHDRAFTAAFARPPGSRQFRCESVEKAGQALGVFQRFAGLLHAPEPVRVATADIDFAGLSCPWCAARRRWTLCVRCKTMVCGARMDGTSFHCRKSCGARFEIVPLREVGAARTHSRAGPPRLGHLTRASLPKRPL